MKTFIFIFLICIAGVGGGIFLLANMDASTKQTQIKKNISPISTSHSTDSAPLALPTPQ